MWVTNSRCLCLLLALCGAACSSWSVVSNPEVESRNGRLSGAPAIGPEIGTIPPVLVPSDFGHNPELATDGVGFLSVQEVNTRIRAVRIDDAGHVLDADWLDLGTDDGSMQLYPAAAFGGGHYLVIWSNLLTDAGGTSHDSIQGRFVKSDGTIEGTASFTLSSGNAIYSSVAWDGAHFVLAYMASTASGANNIHTVLIGPDGTRVDSSDHAVTTSGSAVNPHLDAGDANTLVVWEEYTRAADGSDSSPRIRGARIGRDGTVLDSAPFALSTGVRDEQTPDVAAGSSGFLVVWQTSDMTIHGSVVTDSGVVSAKDFAIDHGTAGAGLPSAAFQGTDYAVGWTDARDGGSLYGTRVSLTGTRSSADSKLALDAPRAVGFGSDHTNFAFNGSHLCFTYLGAEPNGVEGSLLTQTLAVAQGAIPLTGIPNSQAYPYTSFDGTNYVVAWNDQDSSKPGADLHAVRINGAGQVLDPQGVAVSPTDRPSFSFSLASARNGTTLFIWSATDNMPQQRSMAADGTLGTVGAFVTQHGAVFPGLASDGHGYLSAFDAGDSSDTGSVYGHLLGLDGKSGAEFRIDASTLNTGPFVLPAPSGYLVAYARSGSHLVAVSDTGALGQVLDLASTAAVVNGASSQTSSLVAWSDHTGSPGSLQARFVKAGAFSGQAFELTPDSLGYTPAIAWDGTTYWAAWESSTHALEGRTVGEDGTLGSVFSLVPAEVYAPALLSDGNGQLLLSYAKLVGGGRSYRIASRLIGRGASGSGGASGGSAGGGSGGSAGRGSGGSAAGGAAGATNPSAGGTNGGAGAGGSSGSGGTSAGGSGGTRGSGGGGATGGTPATGGTTSPGSGGSSASGGAAAGSSGTGGSRAARAAPSRRVARAIAIPRSVRSSVSPGPSPRVAVAPAHARDLRRPDQPHVVAPRFVDRRPARFSARTAATSWAAARGPGRLRSAAGGRGGVLQWRRATRRNLTRRRAAPEGAAERDVRRDGQRRQRQRRHNPPHRRGRRPCVADGRFGGDARRGSLSRSHHRSVRLVNICDSAAADPTAGCAQLADRCPEYYFNPRSTRTVDNVEACIAVFKQATCTDFLMGLTGACLAGGSGAAGAPCSGVSECQSRSCSGYSPTCGTCGAPAALGAPCGAGAGSCVTGTLCHPATHVCVPFPLAVAHAGAGEPCDLTANPPVGCMGQLVCLPKESHAERRHLHRLARGGTAVPRQHPIGLRDGTRVRPLHRRWRTHSICAAPGLCGTTTCGPGQYCYEAPTVSLRCLPYATTGEACSFRVPEGDKSCAAGLSAPEPRRWYPTRAPGFVERATYPPSWAKSATRSMCAANRCPAPAGGAPTRPRERACSSQWTARGATESAKQAAAAAARWPRRPCRELRSSTDSRQGPQGPGRTGEAAGAASIASAGPAAAGAASTKRAAARAARAAAAAAAARRILARDDLVHRRSLRAHRTRSAWSPWLLRVVLGGVPYHDASPGRGVVVAGGALRAGARAVIAEQLAVAAGAGPDIVVERAEFIVESLAQRLREAEGGPGPVHRTGLHRSELLQAIHHAGPVARGAVQGGEPVQRLGGANRSQRGVERGDGAGGLVQVLLVDDAETELERGEGLGVAADPQPGLEGLGGVGPAPLLPGEHGAQLEGVGVLRLGFEGPAQGGQRASSIADSVQPALGGLEELVRGARAVAGGEPGLSTPLVERGQLGGASLPGEERLHGLGRPRPRGDRGPAPARRRRWRARASGARSSTDARPRARPGRYPRGSGWRRPPSPTRGRRPRSPPSGAGPGARPGGR